MPMRHAIRGLLLHLREHITHDAGRVVGRLLRARDVDGDEGELGPGERVVEVVFHKVVFGEVGDVGVLHVGDVGGVEEADVHGCWFSGRCLLSWVERLCGERGCGMDWQQVGEVR